MVKTDYGLEFPDYHPSPLAPHTTGMPVYWRSDVTGQCEGAMMAYLNGAMNPRQFQIVAGYLQYHIGAPAWEDNGFDLELMELREKSKHFKTREDIAQWLNEAMDIGLDPI